MTSVQRGGSISCFATSFKGLSCLVSFVDSPSERVPLVVGWVSLVTHLREHTVPSPFLLNNVNGARHVRGATGGTETQKQSHTRRQKGSPMQTYTHTNTCKCTQTDQHTHPTGHSNPLSAGDTYFSPQREKGKDAGNFACVFAWMSVSPGMKCTCGVQAWMPLCVCVCMFSSCLYSLFVHERASLQLVCPHPRWDLSPACATSYRQNAKQIRPAPANHTPHPRPPRQRKEQESIEMNGQASASWLELNGNVKLATDPFCLSVEGPVSLGSPSRIIRSQWQSTPHCFYFMSFLSV